MTAVWAVVLFLHLVAAVVWVGGQLVLSLVVLPLLRVTTDTATVRAVAAAIGRRFGMLTGAVLVPALLVTGGLLSWHNGVTFGNLTSTAFGGVLIAKALLVGAMFGVSAGHGLIARRMPGGAARALAISTIVLSVLVLLMAAWLGALPSPAHLAAGR